MMVALDVSSRYFDWLIEYFLYPFPIPEVVDKLALASKVTASTIIDRMSSIRSRVWQAAIKRLLASNGIVELEDVSHSCDLQGREEVEPAMCELRDAVCSRAAQVSAEDFAAWRLECEGVIAGRKRARTER
jgi:hypothetical protein